MTDAGTIAARFERTFANIRDTRMCGLPVLNEAIPVKAVGFREWGEYWLGVLITPWFMNLVLSPRGEPEQGEAELRVTDRVGHAFPAGEYSFIVSEEEGVGRYQMCSLFPSMFVFENGEAAVAAAQAALGALFEAEARPAPGERTLPKTLTRRALFTGFRSDKTTG